MFYSMFFFRSYLFYTYLYFTDTVSVAKINPTSGKIEYVLVISLLFSSSFRWWQPRTDSEYTALFNLRYRATPFEGSFTALSKRHSYHATVPIPSQYEPQSTCVTVLGRRRRRQRHPGKASLKTPSTEP